MAPIYESDVAEERFAQGEWNHYELWEKVEQRLRRHKRLWILATVVVFLVLSAVPIVLEQLPRWRSQGAARRLAQEVNWTKRQAAIDHVAYRIRFAGEGSLDYVVEKVTDCGSPSAGQVVRSGALIGSAPGAESGYSLVGRARGEALGVPGLAERFCYDPIAGARADDRAIIGTGAATVNGNAAGSTGEELAGFGVAPAKDLAQGRIDRMGILLLNGPSADPSF